MLKINIPEVSIILPVYNDASCIKQTILNVYNLNFSKEIIVVDNFSTDGTREILKTLRKDIPYKLILRDKTKSILESLEIGSIYAKGKYITLFDSKYNKIEDLLFLVESITKKDEDFLYTNTNSLKLSLLGRFIEKMFVLFFKIKYSKSIFKPLTSQIIYKRAKIFKINSNFKTDTCNLLLFSYALQKKLSIKFNKNKNNSSSKKLLRLNFIMLLNLFRQINLNH